MFFLVSEGRHLFSSRGFSKFNFNIFSSMKVSLICTNTGATTIKITVQQYYSEKFRFQYKIDFHILLLLNEEIPY